MISWSLKNQKYILVISTLFGGIIGYLYSDYVSCTADACAMKRNPFVMTFMGMLLAYSLMDSVFNLVQKRIKD